MTNSLLPKLEALSKTVHKTYLVRIQAQKRLSSRATAWNLSLIISSAGLLLASIGLLVKDVANADMTTTMLSAVVLVASVWATSLNYGPRSRDMFWNYRQLQSLSKQIDQQIWIINSSENASLKVEKILQDSNRDYNSLLDGENQTTSDYISATIAEQIKEIRSAKNSQRKIKLDNTHDDSSVSKTGKQISIVKFSFLMIGTYIENGFPSLLCRWALTIAPVSVALSSVFIVLRNIL